MRARPVRLSDSAMPPPAGATMDRAGADLRLPIHGSSDAAGVDTGPRRDGRVSTERRTGG
jgi:hypothetical protein